MMTKKRFIFFCIVIFSMYMPIYSKIAHIVFTGRSASGKTMLINELKRRGYCTVPEAATAIFPKVDFEFGKSKEQLLNVENMIIGQHVIDVNLALFTVEQKNSFATINGVTPLFYDRSVLDIFGYASFLTKEKFGKSTLPNIISNCCDDELINFDLVFILDPPGFFEHKSGSTCRIDTNEQKAEEALEHIVAQYEHHNFELIKMPFIEGAEKRADWVIDYVTNYLSQATSNNKSCFHHLIAKCLIGFGLFRNDNNDTKVN